jgi:septal ring factor EnvC (AmiA/AmiB activator)
MARRVVSLALAPVLLAALAAPPAFASRVSRKKKELARIQSELRKTRDELARLKASEDSLGKDVDRLKSQDASSRRRVRRLQDSIREAERRRADLTSRLDSASRVDDFWSAALASETERESAALAGRSDFYGTEGLWADEFRRAAILEKARHLRGLKGFKHRTERAAADARRRAAALAASRRRAQTERDGRRREYEAKKAQLAQTQSQVAAAARHAAELEENAKALTALIDTLGRARIWGKHGAPSSLEVPRHSLPWPTGGRLLTAFGREKDPELGTWIVHQGVTIAAPSGTDVSAVADGTVIFAGAFRSYGEVEIVDHGGGFFSVYGQLGALEKKKGDEVREGEALARSSGRVYLELRRGTRALDPVQWLKKR